MNKSVVPYVELVRMTRILFMVVAFALVAPLAGCATNGTTDPAMWTFDQGALPPADIALNIPGLGPCSDNPDRTLMLNSQEPVTVLVHGCFGSSGRFRGLAQVLAFHGQQTACFTYNDRESMMLSSGQLTSALDQLAVKMSNKQLTVVGHSQGALIGRKSLVEDRPDPIRNNEMKLRLVTLSGPFAGIAAAKPCGNPLLQVLTFGLIGPICQIITGDKWSEITGNSAFILQPGRLHHQVYDYLKIVTDERGACRTWEKGVCTESDNIFSLEEQRNAIIDGDPTTRVVEVKVGHVEIVGNKRVAPRKLIAILQQNKILKPTEPQRKADLSRLLTKLYGTAD